MKLNSYSINFKKFFSYFPNGEIRKEFVIIKCLNRKGLKNYYLLKKTIYILGFKLPEIETPCIKVERNYKDLINKITLDKISEFVEKLTHDSFVVQVERITDRYQTLLDKLLSVFEQRNFTDDKEITKNFAHEPDKDELKTMTDILHYIGTDPKERKQIEIERKSIYEEGELKAQMFHLPQKPLKSTLAQI